MSQQGNRIPCNIGLLAHVDAGKTTLSEALLYCSGTRRTFGRVDHRNAFLDTAPLERDRGITIFSKQARLFTEHLDITLVDTPGHVDFSAEMERTLSILDCAILVISGTDGIQAHTLTLWRLLEQYQIPTFLFVSKMDLPGTNRTRLLAAMQHQLDSGCLDFSTNREILEENAALCDEALLETYLRTGIVTDGNLRELIGNRKLFPCCFGSGLHLDGIDALLQLLDIYAPRPPYPETFGAQVFKITRDPLGARLTWLKITGGCLHVRSALTYPTAQGESLTEKVQQLRLYSGDRFEAPESVAAGMLCAVTGLSATRAGQGLGCTGNAALPALEPVMTYRVVSTEDPATLLPKLRQLEEEDPMLRLLWDNTARQIQIQLMGRVQLEIFRSLVLERFQTEVTLEDPQIYYKETIADTVEGIGHFEPLRHYAEVHLLLSPLPRGSGLQFETVCPTDVLDLHYQNLILTHLAEKVHRGVLIGAPITDMKLTLSAGRAHLKHTEGGDFRQATYRAVRQGLMQAKSILLEPWYRFSLTVPAGQIGRAITDIRAMSGEFGSPEICGDLSTLTGTVPASEVRDYADQLAAFTQGKGRFQLTLDGYYPCHDQHRVTETAGYNPEHDLDNTPDSVFCAHGAGFTVKWDQVPAYMHLESCLKTEKPQIITHHLRTEDRELEAIMEREFGSIRRRQYASPTHRPAEEILTIQPPRERCLIVDGYNMIFAWENLAKIATTDLDAARRALMDDLSSYAGFRKCRVILVFDGYKRRGNPGEKFAFHNIQVVYTAEGETGDAYIESLAAQIGPNFSVRVATSDSLVQLSSWRSGVLRQSARELQADVERAKEEMRAHFDSSARPD